jgi:hypothetical protein
MSVTPELMTASQQLHSSSPVCTMWRNFQPLTTRHDPYGNTEFGRVSELGKLHEPADGKCWYLVLPKSISPLNDVEYTCMSPVVNESASEDWILDVRNVDRLTLQHSSWLNTRLQRRKP